MNEVIVKHPKSQSTVIDKLMGTNGTINIITAVLMAFWLALGVEEAVGLAITGAIVQAFGFIRELVTNGKKLQWSLNIWTYVVVALTFLAPSLEPLWKVLGPIIDGLINGQSLATMIPLLLPLLNVILAIINGNRNDDLRSATILGMKAWRVPKDIVLQKAA